MGSNIQKSGCIITGTEVTIPVSPATAERQAIVFSAALNDGNAQTLSVQDVYTTLKDVRPGAANTLGVPPKPSFLVKQLQDFIIKYAEVDQGKAESFLRDVSTRFGSDGKAGKAKYWSALADQVASGSKPECESE